MSDLKRCAACGMPAHRYGRNEGQERFDPMACINGLRGRLEALTSPETKRQLIEIMADAPNPMFFKGNRESALMIAEDMLEAVLRAVAGVEEGNNE